ncbi:MAG: hypothetical protein K0S09_2211 [Sphingobacteriaceae bacterium]|jgi:hypothetical protein|nr:hypothetical protein [Sphingobacteriaceae bacterium]
MKTLTLTVLLVAILCTCCSQSKSSEDVEPPPILQILASLHLKSVLNAMNMLNQHGFKLNDKDVSDTSSLAVRTYYYEKKGLSFWISANGSKLTGLSYYPKSLKTIESIISVLMGDLNFKLLSSTHNEDDQFKSSENVYQKESTTVKILSFFDVKEKEVSYSVLLGGPEIAK